MSIKTLVFGVTFEDGCNILEDMIGELKYNEVNRIVKTKHQLYVELKNGNTYRVVPATQNSRGYRCDRAYIGLPIDEEILDCVIKPMLSMSQLPEHQQICYFE